MSYTRGYSGDDAVEGGNLNWDLGLERVTSGTGSIGRETTTTAIDVGRTGIIASFDCGVVINDDGEAADDFRVEGDTVANLLFVDASADFVGIGLAAPAARLHVASDDATTGVSDVLILEHSTTGAVADGIGVGIQFRVEDDGGVAEMGSFEAVLGDTATGSEDARFDLIGVLAGTLTELMHWGVANGATQAEVVVNESGADVDFRVESDNNANAIYLDAAGDTMGLLSLPSSSARLNIQPPTITVPANQPGAAVFIIPSVTEAASGTHSYLAGLDINALALTGGVAATTVAATLRVDGAPSGATTNLAFWVAGGVARFDGALEMDAALDHDGTTVGFYGTAPATQQFGGVSLTNNITSGGTTNQLDDWTDLTTYANSAAAIRNACYQLGRKLDLVTDALRTTGLLQNADV